MAERKLYVLGAGASIGAKRYPKKLWGQDKILPSGNNFFRDLFQMEKTKDGLDFINLFQMTYEGANEMIVQAWRLNKDIQFSEATEWEDLNIEDVFTFFDVGVNMFDKDNSYHKSFKNTREALIDTIWFQLMIRTRGQRCLHLEQLFKELKPDDNVISFNWDTLADATLEHIDNIHFVNYKKLFKDTFSDLENYSKGGNFLKLHGSVNWMQCANVDCTKNRKVIFLPIEFNQKVIDTSLDKYDKCSNCEKKLEPYIIPPTSNKINIQNDSFINKLWLIARNILVNTDEIIFIGYSFPATDFYTYWLFRQLNYLYDSESDTFPTVKITIINPEMSDKTSGTYKRYMKLFKGHEITTFETLQTYIDSRFQNA